MITLPTPITTPAIAEKTADGVWILHLQIIAPSPTQQIKVLAQVAPFISSTGEVLVNQAKMVRIDDVASLAATNQNIANAMGAIFIAIQEQIVTQNLFPAPVAPATT
jgi:hypothetical protein